MFKTHCHYYHSSSIWSYIAIHHSHFYHWDHHFCFKSSLLLSLLHSISTFLAWQNKQTKNINAAKIGKGHTHTRTKKKSQLSFFIYIFERLQSTVIETSWPHICKCRESTSLFRHQIITAVWSTRLALTEAKCYTDGDTKVNKRECIPRHPRVATAIQLSTARLSDNILRQGRRIENIQILYVHI